MTLIRPANEQLVFLPGWGFKSAIWEKTANALNARSILLDIPRVGATRIRKKQLTHLAEALKQQLPPQSTLIGWSLGGLIAIYFCYQYPLHCKRLVLVACTPRLIASPNWLGIPKEKAIQFSKQMKLDNANLITHFMQLIQYPDHTKAIRSYLQSCLLSPHQHYEHLSIYLDLLTYADFRPFYRKLCLPVMHIYGEYDVLAPAQPNLASTEIAPHLTNIIISGAGHIPFLSHQQCFLAHLKSFLC